MHFRRHVTAGEVLTLAEAAWYLRLSKSTMYQRKDIPRHRLPGSRGVRFFKAELTEWVQGKRSKTHAHPRDSHSVAETHPGTVYHRNPRYR